MTPSFDVHLDRLRDLIARVGAGPLFAAPLVTPENKWFPDPWSPDYECVRRILLRMAEVAGLADLDVEVVGFPAEAAETEIPVSLVEGRPPGVAGRFYGIHEGCAWFGVHDQQLENPERLIGVLAHELAHAWRETRDVHIAPHLAEEECTDLTAIVLGFGILLCNTAYEYRVEGTTTGFRSTTRWSHSTMGYLDVSDLAGLLACWGQLKDLPRTSIRKHLGTTQAGEFDVAWDRLAEIDLYERLGIAEATGPDSDLPTAARPREFTLGRAARNIHACVERLVALAGDKGGLVREPLPFPERVLSLPHRALATWGRNSATGTWARTLYLVNDPEWDTQAIVLIARSGEDLSRHALGHVHDVDARRGRARAWLAKLFESGSPFRELLVPSLPTFVTQAVGAAVIGDRDLEPLFRSIVERADPDEVVSETEWLIKHRIHTMLRLDLERTQGMPRLKAAGRVNSKRWWGAVSDTLHVANELSGVPWYAAALRSKRSVQRGDSDTADPN